MEKVKNKLDMWAAFLTRYDLLKTDDLPQKLNDVHLKKAVNVLDVMNFSREEREAYEDHLKWLRIEANTLKKAEAKGEERGGAEGVMERNLEIARNLLKEGMSIELIRKVTGLSEKDIGQL